MVDLFLTRLQSSCEKRNFLLNWETSHEGRGTIRLQGSHSSLPCFWICLLGLLGRGIDSSQRVYLTQDNTNEQWNTQIISSNECTVY
jgi:hypothetical protein